DDPINLTDPFGLDVEVCFYPDAAYGLGHVGFGLPGEKGTYGYYRTGIRFDAQPFKMCKTIPSKPEQDECMRKCREERIANPGTYHLTTRQCTSFVRDCLRKCKLPTGPYDGPRPWPFIRSLPPTELPPDQRSKTPK